MTILIRTTDALRNLITNGDEADRCYAIRTLGVLKADPAIDDIARCLHDEDIDVCIDAAEALGQIGGDKALSPLLESLEHDPDGEVCWAVVSALGRIGGASVADVLQVIAKERPEHIGWEGNRDLWWDVQLEAVRGLGRIQDKTAVTMLLRILNDEESQDIESEVLATLATLGDEGTKALVTRLDNSAVRSRRRATKALGQANSPEAVTALGRALQDNEIDVRIEAIDALVEQGATPYLRAILLLLRDSDEQVRSTAITAVAEFVEQAELDNEMQEYLLPLLQDPSSLVRSRALEALAHATRQLQLNSKVLDAAIINVADDDPKVATAALHLLAQHRIESAIPIIRRQLNQPQRDPRVRRQAALALSMMPQTDFATLSALKIAALDGYQAVRLGALTALMALVGTPVAGHPQADALTDVDSAFAAVMAAVRGEIILSTDADVNEPTAFERIQDPHTTTDTNSVASNDTDTTMVNPNTGGNATANIPLPDIVVPSVFPDTPSTSSTLALGLREPGPTKQSTDEETARFLEVAEKNEQLRERMFPRRNIPVADDVRYLGTRLLADSDTPAAIELLIELLSDNDPRLRQEAAESISRIATRNPAIPELMNAFGALATQLNLAEEDQRLTCARALGRLGNRAAMPLLLEKLEDDADNVRIEAIHGLVYLARYGVTPTRKHHVKIEDTSIIDIMGRLTPLLQNPSNGVRIATAKALADLISELKAEKYGSVILGNIIEAAYLDGGSQAREMGKILRRINPERSANILLTQLKELPDSAHRQFVIEMLEEIFRTDRTTDLQAA